MRFVITLSGLGAICLFGCPQNPQPTAQRGSTENASEKRAANLPNPHGLESRPKGGDESASSAGPEVKLEAVTLTAPAGWERKKPQSSFIEAEFTLPRSGGDTLDGRLTLSVAGGSIEANIDRWKDQFGGSPTKSHQEKLEVNGLTITIVDFSGEFNDQRGPFAPAVKRPDFRMIVGIIPVSGQLHFVKAVGPQRTIEAHTEKIKSFLRTAKPNR